MRRDSASSILPESLLDVIRARSIPSVVPRPLGRRAHRIMGLAWPPLLFLACALFLFRQAILEGLIYFEGDTLLFYYPIARLIDQTLAQGKLPLWTPYIFAGHPLLADGEAGMLYPPNLISYILLPASQAFVALRVLRFFLAGFFAYLYGRSLGLDRPASGIVGLAFAYGSFMVGQIHHTNLGTTALWLPLMLAAIEWSLRASPRRRPAYLMLAGAALGAASLTVHINPLLMMVVFVGLYVPFRLLLCRDVAPLDLGERLRRTFIVLVLPIGIGLALGAVQLLPLWELGSFSRVRGIDYDFATGFATPPANVITLLFPYFFRDADNGYWSPMFRWNTTIYIGVVPLVLAAAALVRARSRVALFFAAIAVISVVLAFGDYLPVKLYALLWQLPPFSSVRGPARFIFWTTLALAVLAGLGMQALQNSLKAQDDGRGTKRSLHPSRGPSSEGSASSFPEGRLAGVWLRSAAEPFSSIGAKRGLMVDLFRFPSSLCLFIVPLTATLLAAYYLTGLAPEATKDLLQNGYLSLKGAGLERPVTGDPFDALRYSLNPTSPWTSRSLLWLVLGAGTLWGWFRWRRRMRLWQGVIIGLVVFDLLGFADHFHPTVPIEDMQAPGPAARFLQQRRGLDRVLTLWPVSQTWPDRLLPLGVAEASGYSSLQPRRHDNFMKYAFQGRSNFLDLLNVRYVIAARGWVPDWLKAQKRVFEDAEVAVYERQQRLPRAFFSDGVRAGTPTQIIASLDDNTFDPRRTAWVEEPLPTAGDRTAAIPRETTSVEIIEYSAESVTVQVETPVTRLLVLTDSFYPGWKAYVDGDARQIYRANYIFRGVLVPPGRHTVRFAFEPFSVILGAGISLAAAVCIVVVLVLAASRPESPTRTSSRKQSLWGPAKCHPS